MLGFVHSVRSLSQLALTSLLCVTGAYVISLSCAVGFFSGVSSVLQCIARDKSVPSLAFLALSVQVPRIPPASQNCKVSFG